jgi:hypothetical protein
MVLLRYLSSIFIDAFGITHPSTEARDRAARYIAFLILALLLGICAVIFVALHAFRR